MGKRHIEYVSFLKIGKFCVRYFYEFAEDSYETSYVN